MLTLTAILLLSVAVRHGLSQRVTCYSTRIYSCSGEGVTAMSGSRCCDQGYLSFQESGNDACELCLNNVICYGSIKCTNSTDYSAKLGLGAMSRDSCCTNMIGGLSYATSNLQCETCPPRTPDPTTVMSTTLPSTTTTTETTTMATTTEEISVPGDIGVVGGELGGSPVNIGAVVGGVIGCVVTVVTITTITIVVIVLLLRARPSPV